MHPTLPSSSDHQPNGEHVLVSIEAGGEEGTVAVIVSGELDLSTGRRLVETVLPSDAALDVRLDLEGVSFMDSAGAAAIDELSERLRMSGGCLEIIAVSEPVKWVLRMSGISPGALPD